ncbi:hypothetical protein MTP99_018751 [Tenebrio molitor]|nr:hypothetical protein MTP99_018751 [Tenebrio molitor]
MVAAFDRVNNGESIAKNCLVLSLVLLSKTTNIFCGEKKHFLLIDFKKVYDSIVRKNCTSDKKLKIPNKLIERVKHFEYLEVTVSYDNYEEPEIDKRMSKGNKAMGSLQRVLTSREISGAAKIRIYRTMVRPAMAYGCETWVLTKKSEIKLKAWERKMLRKIFRGTRTEDGGWRRKTNR